MAPRRARGKAGRGRGGPDGDRLVAEPEGGTAGYRKRLQALRAAGWVRVD